MGKIEETIERFDLINIPKTNVNLNKHKLSNIWWTEEINFLRKEYHEAGKA